jgi:hypothetical protein
MRTSKLEVVARALLASAAVAACSASGCRIGGPSGETITPDAEADRPTDAGVDTSVPADTGGTVSTSDADAPDASGEGDASGNAGGDAALSDAGAAAACAPPAPVLTCDPVCNTGCPFLSRCNVSDTPNQGSCIGIWISTEGSDCIKTASTDPCAVNLSCVNGKCRHLCYHDADCTGATGGACCAEPIQLSAGPSGFRACGPCAP